MAEPIKMPFGMLIGMGPGNHVLDECRSRYEGKVLRGGK